MSSYTTRILEVRVSTSKGSSYKYENLVERYKDTAKEGDYFVLYENFKRQTIKYVNGRFTRTDENIPKVWKLVEFYSDYNVNNRIVLDVDGEHSEEEPDGIVHNNPVLAVNYWCNNGGYIRDNYILNNAWDSQLFSCRGIPSDISQEALNIISPDGDDPLNFAHSHTWVTLAEWEELYNKKLTEFKSKISDIYTNKNINSVNKKLNIILNKLGAETSDDYNEYGVEEEEYLWDEMFENLRAIDDEISRNTALAEHFLNGSYISSDDVRILYFVS